MIDLLKISEEELEKIWADDPDVLNELIIDSNLDIVQLAEVFVQHPILQYRILEITDPIELYNSIYENMIDNANPADYEHDWEEYKKVKSEYISAFNEIKQYVARNPDYSETTIADTIWNAPVDVENWDDPYGMIKRAKEEMYEEGRNLGLGEFEIDELPDCGIEQIATILEKHPGSLSFVKKVFERSDKSLDISALVNYLVEKIDEPYFDSNYGYEDVEGKKRVLKELGYDYEELKEKDSFEINDIRKGNEATFDQSTLESSFATFVSASKLSGFEKESQILKELPRDAILQDKKSDDKLQNKQEVEGK